MNKYYTLLQKLDELSKIMQQHDTKQTEMDRRLQGAELVVSDSYHGMCFSLIFEKQFLVLYPRDGLTRFSDLVAYLGINNRFNLSSNEDINTALIKPVNYCQHEIKGKGGKGNGRVESLLGRSP